MLREEGRRWGAECPIALRIADEGSWVEWIDRGRTPLDNLLAQLTLILRK
ncbi:MAG: hypothetical protein HY644_14725 [Acidobacteria bacterium]|nr:hypothetical protein [Acidobacteriota bacterium]